MAGQLEAVHTLDQEILRLDGVIQSARSEWIMHRPVCNTPTCPHQPMQVLNHMLDDRLGYMEMKQLERVWDESGGNDLYRGG